MSAARNVQAPPGQRVRGEQGWYAPQSFSHAGPVVAIVDAGAQELECHAVWWWRPVGE